MRARIGLGVIGCLFALLTTGTPANETNVARMPVLSDEAQLLSREDAAEVSKVLEAHNARGPRCGQNWSWALWFATLPRHMKGWV
jgi:hypothetical protein